MAEYFSSNLKHLREKKGLSQNKLGSIIGVNQTTIARWEDDTKDFKYDNGVLSYEASALGSTTTIKLERK